MTGSVVRRALFLYHTDYSDCTDILFFNICCGKKNLLLNTASCFQILFTKNEDLRYAPFKNKEKPRKTNKNRGITNKNLFFLVCFCFYLFLKSAEV